MAAGNKFNGPAQNKWNGIYNLGSDAIKALLTNTAPVATNNVYADVSAGELATANGYTVGGATVTVTSSLQASGLYKYIASCATPTWSATGSVGPFRYAIIYDTTPTSPLLKPLLAWWDYGASITMVSGDTFTLQLDPTNGVIQDS